MKKKKATAKPKKNTAVKNKKPVNKPIVTNNQELEDTDDFIHDDTDIHGDRWNGDQDDFDNWD